MQFLDNGVRFFHPNFLVYMGVGFGNPNIRYLDIRIYPLILWQPKISIL